MLLFIGHDPGAKNHVAPIYEQALRLNYECKFIDLSKAPEFMKPKGAQELIGSLKPRILIAGSSLNQGEWEMLRISREMDIRSIVVVDLSAKSKIDPRDLDYFPDLFLVTNDGCIKELIQFGADPNAIVLSGSTHLEKLAKEASLHEADSVHLLYKISPESNLISFFGAPHTADTVQALSTLISILPETPIQAPTVIVRPHPRSPNKHLLEQACQSHVDVKIDTSIEISNQALLQSSMISLSMASTVSLESLVIGTPSAFFQLGWEYSAWDDLYSNVQSIMRIRTKQQLLAFVNDVLSEKGTINNNIENYEDALNRSWSQIMKLLSS